MVEKGRVLRGSPWGRPSYVVLGFAAVRFAKHAYEDGSDPSTSLIQANKLESWQDPCAPRVKADGQPMHPSVHPRSDLGMVQGGLDEFRSPASRVSSPTLF